MVSAGPWLDRGHYLGVIIICMVKIANCLKLNAQNLEIYKAPRVGVTLNRLTLLGSMCVLLQPRPCRLAPRSGSCPSRPPPHPLLLRGPSLTPLGFSLHGNPWRPRPSGPLIPETPRVGARCSSPTIYHGAVCCWLLFFPRLLSTVFPTQKPPVLLGPDPPGPSTSPYPLVVPKHDVTAEHPVDVQVPQRDVPRGD